jgi:2-succinyl-6-hydroxy-2,4-cyclohexadiene-1-carboxylate synthase
VTERVPGEVELHLEREGAGSPPLVLLHGFGGSARNWRPQLRALRSGREVAAFDLRGHARSGAPPDAASYRPERFVADVARVLDHLGAPAAVVGGISMGAGLAARFATAHPERVRGLVLLSPPPAAVDARGAGGQQRAWALAFADAIERDGLEAAGTEFAWGPRSGFDPAAARLVRQGFLEHAPNAVAHTLRELLAVQPAWEDMAASLASLATPVLVVAGERDRVSLAACAALRDALPEAEVVRIPGAGHVVNLEARDVVNAALRGFLGRVP